jgi:lipopolysaccharide transport protein LptA
VAHKDVRVYRETTGSAVPAKAATPADTLSCESLLALLDPDTGEIKSGEFDGGVTVTRDRQHAVAERAVYEDSEFLLSGSPEVTDDQAGSRLSAKDVRVGVGPKQGQTSAMGEVRHTVKQTAGRGILGPGEVVVTSSRMSYSEKTRAGMYRGDVVFRSGTDEIRAYQIQLRGAEGQRRLVASRRVNTIFHSHAGSAAEDKPIHAQAFQMTYDEALGRMTYAHQIEFQQGDMSIRTPESLVVTLTDSGEIGSLTAGENQVAIEMGRGKGSGERVTYSPADRAVCLTGHDAIFDDAEGRRVKAPSLTLKIGEDTILVDGMDRQRTITAIPVKRGPTKP